MADGHLSLNWVRHHIRVWLWLNVFISYVLLTMFLIGSLFLSLAIPCDCLQAYYKNLKRLLLIASQNVGFSCESSGSWSLILRNQAFLAISWISMIRTSSKHLFFSSLCAFWRCCYCFGSIDFDFEVDSIFHQADVDHSSKVDHRLALASHSWFRQFLSSCL